MSSPPADSSPSKLSPVKPLSAQNPPMSWSAVVKKPAPSKKPAAPLSPRVSDNLVPASPANAYAHLSPGSTSNAQTHSPLSSGTSSHRAAHFGEASRSGPMPGAQAHSVPSGLIFSQASRAGQPPPAPASTRSLYTGVYPVPISGVDYYRPPQARTDAQPMAKVTKSFANEATRHSTSERRANAHHTNATMTASLALMNARLAAATLDLQAIGVNNAVDDNNDAIPAYSGRDLVGTVSRPTVSGNAIASPISGGSLAFKAHKKTSSSTSTTRAIGSERESGTLSLNHVPQRRILAVTLSLLCSGVAARKVQNNQWHTVIDFLDQVVPIGRGVPEYDEYLPSIVVAYRYPIADDYWNKFEMAVSLIKLAHDSEKVLGSSAAELDQVNAGFRSVNVLPLQMLADEQIRVLANLFNLR